MHKITDTQSPALRALFQPLDLHLTVPSILAGKTDAPVVADHPVHPQAAATWFHSKLFLVGRSDLPDFNQALGERLQGVEFPAGKAHGQEAVIVFNAGPGWDAAYPVLFGNSFARLLPDRLRQYYSWHVQRQAVPEAPTPPDGTWFQAVDADLLAESNLAHLDYLRYETQSERRSVDEFLAHSFGVCLRNRESLIAWCLSEYNLDDRCEVGIATVDEYQRQGFGRMVGQEFLRRAVNFGYAQVGWHCWTANQHSAMLARSLGYEQVADYSVTVGLFDEG
jgi:RimJ/RimL family protein N-acetyltransferase